MCHGITTFQILEPINFFNFFQIKLLPSSTQIKKNMERIFKIWTNLNYKNILVWQIIITGFLCAICFPLLWKIRLIHLIQLDWRIFKVRVMRYLRSWIRRIFHFKIGKIQVLIEVFCFVGSLGYAEAWDHSQCTVAAVSGVRYHIMQNQVQLQEKSTHFRVTILSVCVGGGARGGGGFVPSAWNLFHSVFGRN